MEHKLASGVTILLDEEDRSILSEYNSWSVLKRKCSYVIGRTRGSHAVRKWVYLHRIIMQAQPGQVVDHINGNRLDNRRHNLRFVTIQENNFNRRKTRGQFPYKGIRRAGNKFQATITIYGKPIYCGTFQTIEDAALAYNQRATLEFGDKACLNPIGSIAQSAERSTLNDKPGYQ